MTYLETVGPPPDAGCPSTVTLAPPVVLFSLRRLSAGVPFDGLPPAFVLVVVMPASYAVDKSGVDGRHDTCQDLAMTTIDQDLGRQRLLAARAAVDRACRTFSNEPEYESLRSIREQLDYTIDNILRDRAWGHR